YAGPNSGQDEAYAIAVDSLGNVYVTGRSYVSPGPGINYDCVTIKYDSTGQEQWIAGYNGPGNGDDEGRAIAIDGSGNVYVTGASINANLDYDYLTIKYNAAGQEQWVARYGASGTTLDDNAVAISIDGSGNVYVTGGSINANGLAYATVKYNSVWQEQWVSRYNGPSGVGHATAMAIDGSDNIYVTGIVGNGNGGSNYGTIKYNSDGQEQWFALYDAPGNNDIANAIAVDAPGSVYVTGASEGPGPAPFDYATVKYNNVGQQEWVARYAGPSDDDEAQAIAVDNLGNVYVTGFSWAANTAADYATIKYNSVGQEQWVDRYDGPANDTDYGYAIAVDNSGNAYVTGGSVGTVGFYDYATVKYSPDGQRQWVARYNGPGSDSDEGHAIAVDSSGNVYVTGYSSASLFDFDYATIKYVQPTAAPIPTPIITPRPSPTPYIRPTPR